MASLLGAAWVTGTAAAGAYNYNMQRFEFDASQRLYQSYQIQNQRNELWGLYREDVRDLFGITTTNLSTYMTIATLFLGIILHMVWVALKNFPSDPPWLVLFLCNCLYLAIAYAVLSVWLAMHGTLASHAAEVKVLTQAVRPPIPTEAEIVAGAPVLSQYEASDLRTFFQIPNLLDSQGGATATPSQIQRDARTREGEVTHGSNDVAERQGQREARGTVRKSTRANDMQAPATTNAFSRHDTPINSPEMQLESERIARILGGPEGGPGRSALTGAHVGVFRQIQETYLTFEAYSRVSLLAASLWLMLTFTYYIVAHWLAKHDAKTMVSSYPSFVSWAGACCLPFTALLAFKLDIYVDSVSIIIVKMSLLGGPLVASLAVYLWAQNRDYRRSGGDQGIFVHDIVPQGFALAACLLHTLWKLIFLWESRPQGAARLPTAFRSVQYADLFGWWCGQKRGPTERLPVLDEIPYAGFGTSAGPANATDSSSQLQAVSEMIQRIFSRGISEHLAAGDIGHLQQLRAMLEARLQNLQNERRAGTQPVGSLASVADGTLCVQIWGGPVWLEAKQVDDFGDVIPFFVSLDTAEVQWERPKTDQTENVDGIASIVHKLCACVSPPADNRPSGVADDVPCIEPAAPHITDEEHMRGLHQERPTAAFEPPRVHPDSIAGSSSMAWKYFFQLGLIAASLWILSFGWIAFCSNCEYHEPTQPGQASARMSSVITTLASLEGSIVLTPAQELSSGPFWAERLTVSWPYNFFHPSALACEEATIILGERFAVYGATIQLGRASESLPHVHGFVPALLSRDISAAWGALGMIAGGTRILLVEVGGTAVMERSLPGNDSSSNAIVARRWTLGLSANFSLRAITGIAGDAAATICAPLGGAFPEWALYGTTNLGEVVSLCPWGGDRLEPVQVVSRHPRVSMDFTGLASDEEGTLWLLARSKERAELRALSVDGASRGAWQLPHGRSRVLTGLCALSKGQGLLLAVAGVPGGNVDSELWHLKSGSLSLARTS